MQSSLDLNPIFDALRSETISLHTQWKLYRSLFDRPGEELLSFNNCAPTVFATLQSLLLDDCILRICRLTDPLVKGKYGYVSIARLASVETTELASTHWPELPKLLACLDEKCIPIRKHRNTRIAHADLAQVLTVKSDPLPSISIQHINTTLSLIAKCLNCVENPLRHSHTFYDAVLVTVDEDSARLMQALQLGDHPRDTANPSQ